MELRSWAWAALWGAAFHRREFEETLGWATRRFEVIDEINDPDHVAEVYETVVPALESLARYAEGRRLARAHLEHARALSPHHRLHSAALQVEVEELATDWAELVRITPFVERAAEENAETSCIRAPRSLLLCALAAECVGDAERARELERIATRYVHEEYGLSLAHPRLRLALVRGDRAALEAVLEPQDHHRYSFGPGPVAAALDACALLRAKDRVEAETRGLLARESYLRPFAQRALAIVREDEVLLEQAQAGFSALGLEWHRAQTERLLAGL